MTDEHANPFLPANPLNDAHNRLKRLQEQVRAGLPPLTPARFTGSFTLDQETIPAEAAYRVQVMVYPQDPFVGQPEIRQMSADDLRPGLINTRFQIADSALAPAEADDNGNYLYTPGTLQFDQINAFYYATLTLRMYERYARRALSWAFNAPRLRIDPHVGNEANAFYNEQEQLLGFQTYAPFNGDAPVSTAESADIVSHETAHAILDGLRTLYNQSFGLGANAFHESFGDMSAVLVALHDDALLRKMLDWTKNDVRLTSFISAIAEQITDTLTRERAHTQGHSIYLRNALNTLTALPFDALTYNPPDPQFRLGRQPHNYSRLFTGAFYDAMAGIYDDLLSDGGDGSQAEPHIALSRARDIMGRLLITAVECGPVGELTFYDMALAFLAADRLLFDGEYDLILAEVFAQRGLGTFDRFNEFRQQQRALPDLVLPGKINSPLDASLFLEQAVIPTLGAVLGLPDASTLTPLATYRNADGCAFVTYHCKQKLTLSGSEFGPYSNASLDLYGGLALAFGADNHLRSALYRPVTDEDERQIRIMIRDLIQEGVIVHPGEMPEPVPHALLLPAATPGDDEALVRYPATVDLVQRFGDFVEYILRLAHDERG